MLGLLRVVVGGAEVRLGGPRQRAVFALLVLTRGRPAMAERIMDDVWGDAASSRSRTTLQVYMSNLRQELRKAGAPATIESVPGGYALVLPVGTVDLIAFEECVGGGHDAVARMDFVAALTAYDAALAIAGGGLLEDLRQFECFDGEVDRVERLRHDAAEERVRCLVELGRLQEAVLAAETVVRNQPLREGAWYQLALALYRGARQADSLRVLQRAREVLGDAVGLEPGPELRELERQILSHAPELSAAGRFPRVRWLDPQNGVARHVELVDGMATATVGRAPGSNVVLVGDPLASRTHCHLRRRGATWEVWADPLAANGTHVNGVRVAGTVALRHGDRIRAGETVLLFETMDPRGSGVEVDLTTVLGQS